MDSFEETSLTVLTTVLNFTCSYITSRGQDVTHRDLKPGNALLSNDGHYGGVKNREQELNVFNLNPITAIYCKIKLTPQKKTSG